MPFLKGQRTHRLLGEAVARFEILQSRIVIPMRGLAREESAFSVHAKSRFLARKNAL
jgi:hypothetical protein